MAIQKGKIVRYYQNYTKYLSNIYQNDKFVKKTNENNKIIHFNVIFQQLNTAKMRQIASTFFIFRGRHFGPPLSAVPRMGVYRVK